MLPTRNLGANLAVSSIGLGCMGMSQNYGPIDREEAVATLRRALELGVTMFDTADIYGNGENERLVGGELAGLGGITVATKFGRTRRADGSLGDTIGTPTYVRAACEGSLGRLGTDTIDLYYQHRVDQSVPIEETWGALSELVTEGKVRALGISEASATTIRRAHAVHPIAAAQYEYSLFTRDIEDDILPTVRELGIGLVCYSPLGRGSLTASVRSRTQLTPGDSRLRQPRFAPENLDENVATTDRLAAVGARIGLSAAQLALAWLLAQGPDIVPIPGTKRRRYIDENVAAAVAALSSDDLAAIEAAVPRGAARGASNTAAQLSATER